MRGRIYLSCNQCNELLSKDGYRDNSIALSLAEAFPYCSDCIKKNGWSKCSSCDKWGDFGDKKICSDCKYKEDKKEIEAENQKRYERTKEILAEKLKNLQQQKINEVFTCLGTCGKVIGLKEKAYTWQGESGYYCQNCIENKVVNEHNKNYPNDSNNQLVCFLCKTKSADYRWPDNGKLICESCKPRFIINMSAMEKIFKNQEVNIDSLELPEADKVSLRAGQKILKGENVNIDGLNIDEEDKQDLRELQKQHPPQKDNSSSNYAINCQGCGKKYETTTVPPRCQHCRSRNIKVYDESGFLQILPADNQENDNPNKKNDDDISPYIIIPIGLTLSAIFYLLVRWWRKKKNKH